MRQQVIDAHDGHAIQTYIWEHPTPRGWVHINHGMAEHGARYDWFAQQLVSEGWSVVAHDHRGHGPLNHESLGHFADQDGWNKVLEDLSTVRKAVCSDQLPFFLFAHSMGSFIAQSYLSRQQIPLDGLILSGSNFQPSMLSRAGLQVAKIEKLRVGYQQTSPLLQFLSFGAFNKRFKPVRTDFDWLSTDDIQVDQYIADPYCGFAITTESWCELFKALAELFSKNRIALIQKDLPIYILGGDQDPVGAFGNGLKKLQSAYQNAGQSDVTLSLYSKKRHEMLNETNRPEVVKDLFSWMNARSQQKLSA